MRRVLGLAGAVALVAAYLFLYELPRRQAESERLASEGRALHFDPTKIHTIRKERGNSVLQLVFDGDEWRMLSPRQEPANARNVQDFLRSLSEAQRFRKLGAAEDALSYGLGRLAENATRLQLDGDGTISVEIGDLTPTAGACYYRPIGQEEVEVADAILHRLAQLPASYFRTQRLGDLADSTVVEVGMHGRWVGRRGADRLWRLRGDPSVELRQWMMDDLVFDLVHSSIRSFVREDIDEREFAGYGLLPPALVVCWATVDGDSGRVALGNDSDEPGLVYARRGDDLDLLIVPDALIARGQLALEDWIDSNPLDEDFKSMREVEATLADGQRALARGPKAFDLRAVLPDGSTRDPEELHVAIRNVYYGLARFDALGSMEFADAQAAERAIERWEVTARLVWDDHERRLRLGWNGSGESHWIQLDDQPRIHRVERDLFFRLQGWVLSANSDS